MLRRLAGVREVDSHPRRVWARDEDGLYGDSLEVLGVLGDTILSTY